MPANTTFLRNKRHDMQHTMRRRRSGPGQRIAAAATAMLLTSIQSVAAHNFPYVPAQVLAPGPCYNESACDGRDAAYVFTSAGQFLSYDYSSKRGQPTLQTVTSALPFAKNDGEEGSAAFSAVRTGNGTVMVYAGACDGQGGSLWTFSQSDGAVWREKTLTAEGGGKANGPYFLGGSLAFSSTLAPVMDEPTFYTYGGICGTVGSDASTWQSSGNYTTDMMSLQPDGSDADTYSLGVASTSGPATPIAGFTLTALAPSVSKISGEVTQQASYVLLGGNTRQAFINISTAAVWSLPEQSWTYVAILGPDDSGRTELAVKDAGGRRGAKRSSTAAAAASTAVESRSGHTAVLSEDGRSVVVLGGWVGDVSNAATPQLAVLRMSEAYSGWRWTVPESQPHWDGDGIYGHGAALLPGNVMMVYGGWTVGGGELKMKEKRQKRATASVEPRFLNLTSMEWTSTYTNPNKGSSAGAHDAPGSSDSSPTARTLGLGLGLGLGLALLIAILVGLLIWRHRAKKRAAHEEAVRAIAQDAAYFMDDNDEEMLERDDVIPWALSGDGWYTGGEDAYQNGERSLGYETMRRGSTYSVPFIPPPNIYRKPVPSRPRSGYMPAGARQGNFMSVPGRIHPILEDDEEDYESDDQHNTSSGNEPHTPTSEVPSDPFLTPTAGSTHGLVMLPPPSRSSSTPSPEGVRRHDPEVQDWVMDADAAEGMLTRLNTRQGRRSPSRRPPHLSGMAYDDDGRTSSGLSESTRSQADSLGRSGTGRRTPGIFLVGSTLLGSGDSQNKPGSSSSSSYNTAKSTFGTLQAEGPSLLMGNTASCSQAYDEDDRSPGSPSKSKPRRGWLGSLRRVFSNSGTTSPSPTTTTASSRDDSPRRGSADYEPPPLVGLRGELLRRKQGRQDWAVGSVAGGGGGGGGGAPEHGETEWDIEKAVEQRLVQVMFTVPRERLRVVNADYDDEDDDVLQQDEEAPQQQQQPRPVEAQIAELVDTSGSGGSSTMSSLERRDDTHHHHQQQQDPEKAALMLMMAPPPPSLPASPVRALRLDSPPRLSTPERRARAEPTLDLEPEMQTPEAERRRTRVLQMVDSIESQSREGSPGR